MTIAEKLEQQQAMQESGQSEAAKAAVQVQQTHFASIPIIAFFQESTASCIALHFVITGQYMTTTQTRSAVVLSEVHV